MLAKVAKQQGYFSLMSGNLPLTANLFRESSRALC